MIRVCAHCEKKFQSPHRGWYDKHILHVCKLDCLFGFIEKKSVIPPKVVREFIHFKHSDRSFRSKYESRFAGYLSQGVSWLYEPFQIEMPNGDFYVPDFLAGMSVFFEVKGIWDGRGKTKFKAFVEAYPDLPIFVVDLAMLSTLGRRGK